MHDLIVAETGATVGGNSIGTADFIQCAGAVAMVHWHGENGATRVDWVELGLPTQSAAGFGGSAVVREPAGVVAAITPFNYPFQLNLLKVVRRWPPAAPIVLKPHPVDAARRFRDRPGRHDAGFRPGCST